MAVTFAFYVGGFKNATDRLRGAGDDWERGFAALYETLAWCGSIRDWLHKHQRSVKDECPQLQGAWFVRNMMIHVHDDPRAVASEVADVDVLAEAVESHGASLADSMGALPPNVWDGRDTSSTSLARQLPAPAYRMEKSVRRIPTGDL